MRTFASLAAGLLVAGVASAASAQTNGFYVGLMGVQSILPKQAFSTIDAPGGRFELSNFLGYGAAGQFGYGWGRWRLEEEFMWRQNAVRSFDNTGAANSTARGNIQNASFMTHLLYDIPTRISWAPYLTVGVGIGALNIKMGDVRSASGVPFSADDQWTVAGEAIIGEIVPLSDLWSMRLDFRFQQAQPAKFNTLPAFGGNQASLTQHSWVVSMGFIYQYGKFLYGGM